MRIVDRRTPWLALAAALFLASMVALRWLMKGISEDFGGGVAVGLFLGIAITGLAVGWRRGELAPEADPRAHERELPRS